MDNKQFNNKLSKKISLDYKETASLIQSVASALSGFMTSGDKVAIPGFGTFSARKLEEKISLDRSTGKRLLLPPQIIIEFSQSALLTKHLTQRTNQPS